MEHRTKPREYPVYAYSWRETTSSRTSGSRCLECLYFAEPTQTDHVAISLIVLSLKVQNFNQHYFIRWTANSHLPSLDLRRTAAKTV